MAMISILVPVYNVERYLERCLESIINQTLKDIEIICMNDGSTDTSGEILNKYANMDSRIKVIHKGNSGYGNTMNQALSLAEGKYIGIVESDDYISLDMYEKMLKVAEYWNLDFVKTDFYRVWDREDGTALINYQALTSVERMYDKIIEPNCDLETYFLEKFIWNALYRRSFLIEHNIMFHETPGASYQDNGFWFQTFYFAKRAMFLKLAFYYYRQDNPNSSINSDSKVFAMKNEYDYIRDFLVQQKEVDKRFYRICFHFRMDGYLYTLSMLADQYKLQLAETIKDECALYEEKGEANFDRLSKEKIQITWQICESPNKYVEQQTKRNAEIRKRIGKYKHIIIYGVGNYGKRVYENIQCIVDKSCMIDIAVTNLKGEKMYYCNKVIKEIADFEEKCAHCLVILSVKSDTQAYKEMMRTLQKMQFEHVITYQDIWYNLN